MRLPYKILSSYHKLLEFISYIAVLNKSKFDHSKLICRLFKFCTALLQLVTHDKDFATLNARSRNGFTLIELIVTVSVLAIIITIATPSILTQLTRMEAKRVKSQLESALALAKAESYISRQNILVCLSNDGQQCHRNSDEILLLFVDKNINTHFDAQVDTLLTKQALNLKYSTL